MKVEHWPFRDNIVANNIIQFDEIQGVWGYYLSPTERRRRTAVHSSLLAGLVPTQYFYR